MFSQTSFPGLRKIRKRIFFFGSILWIPMDHTFHLSDLSSPCSPTMRIGFYIVSFTHTLGSHWRSRNPIRDFKEFHISSSKVSMYHPTGRLKTLSAERVTMFQSTIPQS